MIPDYLPDAGDLINAPERAHLAMLSTAAHLTEQALLLEYRVPSAGVRDPESGAG